MRTFRQKEPHPGPLLRGEGKQYDAKQKTDKLMAISIIIPTYKRKESVLRLLNSLIGEVKQEYEILIVEQKVNNRETFLSFAKQHHLPLQYYFLENPSTSAAKNVGIRHAKGKYVVFFDDDVTVEPEIFTSYIHDFEADHDNLAAICGRVITAGQKIEPGNNYTGRITPLGGFSDGFSSEVRQYIDTVIGCNAAWRKEVLHALEGFDEQFTGNAMREESDLSLRAKKLGYTILFEPKTVVHHLREETGGARKTEGRLQWYFDFFSNETYFFLKHFPKFFLIPILLTRWEWIARCMFGFGREVSLRSIKTPMEGVMDGIRKYLQFKRT